MSQTQEFHSAGERRPRVLALVVALGVVTASAGAVPSASADTPHPPGTVVSWGGWGGQDAPVGLAGVTAIAAGFYHNLALKADGTVVGWGENINGQTNVPVGLTGVRAVAAGGNQSLALKRDGTVVAWGADTGIPAGLAGVTAIAAGGWHTLALKNDGTVVAWGKGAPGDFDWGQANVPAGLADVSAIAAGRLFSLALERDGTMVGWGNNWAGQASAPAGLSGVTAIAAGGDHSLALKADGTVAAWGSNWQGQTDVPAGLTGIRAVAAGAMHSLALKADGTVVAWGYGGFGQTDVPAGLAGARAIAAGFYHSLALIGTATHVSGHGRFGTEGNGEVRFALSSGPVSLERIRGQRFNFEGEVGGITGSGNTATLEGAGRWNGESGYAFEVSVVDNARWGRLKDTIEVVIRGPRGAVAFTSFGAQLLKQGDLEVTPG